MTKPVSLQGEASLAMKIDTYDKSILELKASPEIVFETVSHAERQTAWRKEATVES
jgi:hypothetical protein